MSENNKDLLVGLFIGGLIGAAMGVLFAPKSGKETREDIVNKANELFDKAKAEYEKGVERSKAAYEAAVKKVKGMGKSLEEKAEEGESEITE